MKRIGLATKDAAVVANTSVPAAAQSRRFASKSYGRFSGPAPSLRRPISLLSAYETARALRCVADCSRGGIDRASGNAGHHRFLVAWLTQPNAIISMWWSGIRRRSKPYRRGITARQMSRLEACVGVVSVGRRQLALISARQTSTSASL